MRFTSGKQMLKTINHSDLYCESRELYVFNYNVNGSICYYHIDSETMHELRLECDRIGEGSVSALLGVGGNIIDDPSYEYFKEGDYSNLDWCNDNYAGEWEEV